MLGRAAADLMVAVEHLYTSCAHRYFTRVFLPSTLPVPSVHPACCRRGGSVRTPVYTIHVSMYCGLDSLCP